LTIQFTIPSSTLEMIGVGAYPNGALVASVRRGNAPNANQSDAVGSYVAGSPMVITMQDPLPGYYYVLLQNTYNGALNYTALFVNTSCGMNLAGPNCSSPVMDLTGNTALVNMVGIGNYQYFTVNETNQLVVGVGTTKVQTAAPILLASFLNWPTNSSFMAGMSGNPVNFIWAETDFNVTWQIGVWAYTGMEYSIWTYYHCPNNCMGTGKNSTSTYGTCNQYTGFCECNSHYGNLTCTRTGLAVVWIVLIVIACAIVLAIAIGVPLACYLRNKRRSRYERV